MRMLLQHASVMWQQLHACGDIQCCVRSRGSSIVKDRLEQLSGICGPVLLVRICLLLVGEQVRIGAVTCSCGHAARGVQAR